jgi:Flp pilus assembly protein TadG
MVPVLLGAMGFAVDLGRMYLVRGELNQAASAMAMAAAAQLNGTSAATGTATTAANATIATNRYNFGSATLGLDTFLTSQLQDPAFFDNVSAATSAVGATGAASTADGTTARHVTVNLTADAPLLFWSILTLGQSRKTSIAAAAVAGVSAPVCTACGIEPFAIQRADASDGDPVDFGFVSGNLYTFGYQCNAPGAPTQLAGQNTTGRINYLLINRFDAGGALVEDQQLFRLGSQGLLGSTSTSGFSCSIIGGSESLWTDGTVSASPQACNATTPNALALASMCGLSTRLTDATPTACNNLTDVATLAAAYNQDTDLNYYAANDYASYTGNNRRLITVPVVETLSATTPMTVVGFRQFLIQPNLDGSLPNVADGNSRFVAMYLDSPQLSGAVAPVKQGSLGPACGITSGPGKVVLHQ